MTLRELAAAGTEDQRQVRVHGLIVGTERAPQREDAMRRVEEVFAAQHVRDRHLEVVDRVGEEEHGRSVRSHDHEVAHRRPLDRTSPRTMSTKVARPSSGVRKRTDARATLGGERAPAAPR